jgi:hypothetical protein
MCVEGTIMMKGIQSFVSFAAVYYDKTSSLCGTILTTYALVWMSWHFYKLAAASPCDSKQIVEDLTRIVVGLVLLKFPAMVWELYTTMLKVGIWSAAQAFSATDGSTPGNSGELVCFAIGGIDHAIWRNVSLALDSMSLIQLANLVWTLVLFFPVAFLMMRIIKHVSEPLVDVSVLFCLMPFVVLAGSIGPLAGAAMQSLKLMITALKELIVVSVITGVMMSMLNEASGWSPMQGDVVNLDQSKAWLGSGAYFMTVAMVCFFYFAFDRAVQMPGRLFSMFTPRGINLPKPF